MADADPCGWTVSEVKQYILGGGLKAHVSRIPNVSLPDLQQLATKFEASEIDGLTLLNEVNSDILQREFGLKLRTCAVLNQAIRCLRQESMIYSDPCGIAAPAKEAPASTKELPFVGVAHMVQGDTSVIDPPHNDYEHLAKNEPERKKRRLNMNELTTLSLATSSFAKPLDDTTQESATAVLQQMSQNTQDRPSSAFANLALAPGPDKGRMTGGYLCDQKLPIDKLIYGDTPLGAPTGPIEPCGWVVTDPTPNADIDRPTESRESYFIATPRKRTAGEAVYAYHQLRHLMTNPKVVDITYKEKPATAVYPYSERVVLENNAMAVTLFQHSTDGVSAIRTNTTMLQHQDDGIEALDAGDSTFDYLLDRWGNSGNDVVASDDDSASITSSLANEIEQDQLEEAQEIIGAVTKERASEIIGEAISDMTRAWKENEQMRREKMDAWRIWRSMRGKRRIRDGLIVKARTKIDHWRKRLKKLTNDMLLEEWLSEKSLKEQCACLETTVESIAEEEWNIDVLKRREEPDHISKPRKINGEHTTRAEDQTPAGDSDMQDFVESDDGASVMVGDDELDLIYHEKPAEQTKSDITDDEASNLGGQDISDAFHSGSDDLQDIVMDEPRSPSPSSEFNYDLPHFPTEVTTIGTSPAANKTLNTMSDSDDGLPSPSKFSKQVRPTQSSPHVPIEPVIVNLLSSDIEDQPTPISAKRIKKERESNVEADPSSASPREIEAWSYEDLESSNDLPRLMLKLVWTMDSETRRTLLRFLSGKVNACLRAVKLAHNLLPSEPPIRDGETPDSSKAITYSTRLYLCWYNADHEFWNADPKLCADSEYRVQEWDDNDLYRWFASINSSCKRVEKHHSDINDAISIDSDDDDTPLATPKGRRKKLVAKDMQGQALRKQALERHLQSQQKSSDQNLLGQMISPAKKHGERVAIHTPEDEDPSKYVYLNRFFSERLKPHQVEGISFMWRELTTAEEKGGQGCVLAHTMGLGKTAQTIALLVTMAENTRSGSGSSLPPRHLKKPCTLILCPPTLIQNWILELTTWDPQGLLGPPHYFESSLNTKEGRLHYLRDWNKQGGVLVIGYSMLHRLVRNMNNAGSRYHFTDEEHEEIVAKLLEEPSLVIADEAHTLRNQKSGISKVAGRFKTERRIALTGSPMSNNIDEIYALISWVAPRYLGSREEFQQYYAVPIEQGSYQESTYEDRRRSLKKLAALNKLISPKLNRADITVLKGSIKQKVEFVLTVPLTQVQNQAYKKYVDLIMNGKDNGTTITQARLFGWLALLTLLTNHPWCFRKKLLEPRPVKKAKKAQADETELSESNLLPKDGEGDMAKALDEHVTTHGIDEFMVQGLIGDVPDAFDVSLSHKTQMIKEIVKASVHIRDKLLIFSQSILSLDYLEDLSKREHWRYGRIDGSMPQAKRTTTLEHMRTGHYDVLLISTRAGGVGLNIQQANRVIIFDSGFNPTWEEQAIGRAYRLGQQKAVYVYRFVAGGTFETKLYNKAIFKTSLASRVVDKKNPERNATAKPAEWLHHPHEVFQEDLSAETGNDLLVLDKILAKQTADGNGFVKAIKTMETLQRDADDEPLTAEEQREVEEELAASRLRKSFGIGGTAKINSPVMGNSATSGMAANRVGIGGANLSHGRMANPSAPVSDSHN